MKRDSINIAVLVSGGGTNLEALIRADRCGRLHSGHIRLVISNKSNAFALNRAMKAGIPAAVVTKEQFGNQKDFELRICELISEYQIDLIILAGFMCILSRDFTARYEHRIINIHPSLIPSFCGTGFYGLHVHEAALARGVKITGATVHYVNEIPDGGEIILQRAVKVLDGDTAQTLQLRVMRLAEWKILPEAAELVSRKILQNEEQS